MTGYILAILQQAKSEMVQSGITVFFRKGSLQ